MDLVSSAGVLAIFTREIGLKLTCEEVVEMTISVGDRVGG
jgi:hypothetical protein